VQHGEQARQIVIGIVRRHSVGPRQTFSLAPCRRTSATGRQRAGYLVGSVFIVGEIDHSIAIVDFDIQHAQHGEAQRAGHLGSSAVADI
jgi:hypothetical protein